MNIVDQYPVLYKTDSKGKIREWWMELGNEMVKDDIINHYHRSTYGTQGGEKHTTEWTWAEPKNVGKSNETNSASQAMSEIESMYEAKQTKDSYCKDMNSARELKMFKPMLAKNYDDHKNKLWAAGQIVCSQPKLDGIRCIVREDGLFTRQNKPIVSCPHIWKECQEILKELPKGSVLDGELYNHDLRDNFQILTSLIRKQSPDAQQQKDIQNTIQLHLYDRSSEQNFYSRWGNFVIGFADYDLKYIKFVTTSCPANQKELDQLYEDYIEAGYEGQMVRWGNTPYEMKRSQHLLKRKEFESEEFPVLTTVEGSGDWTGAVKKLVVEYEKGKFCGAGVKGMKKELTELWKKGEIPTWATVQYFGKSNDGVPRFPVVTDYGFGERDD